jgi:hypothetical protein
MRSWHSTHEFLMEAFGKSAFASSPPETLDFTAVDYVDTDGTQLRGYLALPKDSMDVGLRPTIVIIPYVFDVFCCLLLFLTFVIIIMFY